MFINKFKLSSRQLVSTLPLDIHSYDVLIFITLLYVNGKLFIDVHTIITETGNLRRHWRNRVVHFTRYSVDFEFSR